MKEQNSTQMEMKIDDDDKDLFPPETVNEVFPNEYHLAAHSVVALDKSYIVHLDLKENSDLLVGLSSNAVAVYDPETLVKKTTFKAHTLKLTGVKLSPQTPQLAYTSSLDQTIKLWDLRDGSNKPRLVFVESPEGQKAANGNSGRKGQQRGKPLTAFDVNAQDRFLAAGTEQVATDSFLLFWDIRNASLLGGYWNTFGDDVTEVKFHPENPDTLITGGADSTLNVFDISNANEEEALITSTIIESSVNSITWYSHKGKFNNVAVTTDDNQMSLWCTDDGGPTVNWTREDVALGLRRKNQEWTYLISCHFDSNAEKLYAMAGSSCTQQPCLRLLAAKKNKLRPFANLSNKSVRNTTVRCSIYNPRNLSFYTGSEEGFLCLWKPGQSDESSSVSTPNKIKSAKKSKVVSDPY